MAVFATGWSATLTADLSKSATVLPISTPRAAKLCTILEDADTYLVIRNGTDAEVVRATCDHGTTKIIIERGEDPIAAPAGACVDFEVTEELLGDFVVKPNSVCEIIPGPGLITTEDGCAVTISLDDCDEVSWRVGNMVYTYKDGCVTEKAAGTCVIPPGRYDNASITVNSDGIICSIESGSNIVYSSNPCCGDCDDVTPVLD